MNRYQYEERARVAARIAELVGIIHAIAGLAAGFLLIQGAKSDDWRGDSEWDVAQLLSGVAAVVAGVLFGSAIFLMGTYVTWRLERAAYKGS